MLPAHAAPQAHDRATPPQADAPPTVSQLLQQSRAAHLRKKHAAGKADRNGVITSVPNYTAAERHITEALDLRRQAEALDPEHTDPAWADDQSQNRGLSSQQMIDWFEEYLRTP